MKTKTGLFGMLLLVGQLSVFGAPGDPPNVIFIFADDMAPGMLSSTGRKIVTTLNIDRLEVEGISFQNYYGAVSGAPVRRILGGGLHDGRTGGVSNNLGGKASLRAAGKIAEEECPAQFAEIKSGACSTASSGVLLTEEKRTAGGKTAEFYELARVFLARKERVKWFGRDFYEGLNDYTRSVYPPCSRCNGKKIPRESTEYAECGKVSVGGADVAVGKLGKTYRPDVFVERMLRDIREPGKALRAGKKVKPFFIYYPVSLSHSPSAVPAIDPNYANDPRLDLSEKKYASRIKTLDDHVGLIMAELKKQGLAGNTILFFSSDNGREMLSGAGARAGLKRSVSQDGLRCQMIVRWPGRIPRGITTGLLSAHYDFMATLADSGGGDVPDEQGGISCLPTLLGKPQSHDYVFVMNDFGIMGGGALIMRKGWILIEENMTGAFHLYNVEEDKEPRHDLSAHYPERVAKIKVIFQRDKNTVRTEFQFNVSVMNRRSCFFRTVGFVNIAGCI